MTLLEVRDLSVVRRGRSILRGVSLTVRAGEVVGLIGPNGAGKSTLMRAALGLLPHEGESSLARMPPSRRPRHAAFLPQSREIAWPMRVRDVVALGRLPHGAGRVADARAVDRAIARLGLASLADRTATRLSGGEQARVLIARAVAQETPLLLADEPTAGLDPAHAISTMRAFRDLATEGHAVVVSLHDLGLAARYCDRLVLLAGGTVRADGPPAAVLTDALMAESFGIRGHWHEDRDGAVFQPLDVVQPKETTP